MSTIYQVNVNRTKVFFSKIILIKIYGRTSFKIWSEKGIFKIEKTLMKQKPKIQKLKEYFNIHELISLVYLPKLLILNLYLSI